MTYWIMRALFRILFRVLGSWEVHGHENVPTKGPVLVTPNHLSFLDPPLIGCALQRPGWFMAKAELFDIPGFRWLITGMHAYPIKRGAADRAALKRTLEHLSKGEIVCVFPEGTRNDSGGVGPLEVGVGMLAVKSGAPIVPVAIRGTDQMLPRGAKRLYRSKIHVQFGPPLHLGASLAGRTDREAYQEATDQIREALVAVVSGTRAEGPV